MPKNALTELLAKGRLVPCRAAAGAALTGEGLPRRIKLFNWGANERIDGPAMIVNERTLSSLAANQEALGFDRIVLDYNHQSVPGHPNFKPDPREHAAHGVVEVIDGDGVYLTGLAWTPSGEQNARNYPDLSPTPLLDPETNEVLFIHSVALCTQGKTKGLTFLSAGFLAPLSAPQPATESTTMLDPKKLLLTILGLAEDATDEAITAAAEKMAEKKPEVAPEVTALSAGLANITKRLDQQERTALLAAAVAEGKLVTNSIRELPLENLRKVLGELEPNVVPLSARTPAAVADAGKLTPLSAEDKVVAAQLGLTDEEMRAA